MERRSLEERFWEKVLVAGPDECWLWTAAKAKGYGTIGTGGKECRQVPAHRVSWEIHNGPIPDGLWALHKCDVRPCVNPNHLFLGTRQDNVDDMVRKGRHGRATHPERIAGRKNPNAKLTEQVVRLIRSGAEINVAELAKEFGVDKGTIWNVKRGVGWEGIGEKKCA